MKNILVGILCSALITTFTGCRSDTSSAMSNMEVALSEETDISENEVVTTDKIKLTLEKVIELSQKGEALTWNDFEPYDTEGDVGSGLYILRYNMEEPYYILIGGANMDVMPMYIYLTSTQNPENFIDIRTESVEDFIEKNS